MALAEVLEWVTHRFRRVKVQERLYVLIIPKTSAVEYEERWQHIAALGLDKCGVGTAALGCHRPSLQHS
jgi:hypothetical protein